MEVMNRFLWVQSSTFWDHVNIVDIVMQVIGILSSYMCFVRRHLTKLGAKPLPFFQKCYSHNVTQFLGNSWFNSQ